MSVQVWIRYERPTDFFLATEYANCATDAVKRQTKKAPARAHSRNQPEAHPASIELMMASAR
jgi:hypothetical protein